MYKNIYRSVFGGNILAHNSLLVFPSSDVGDRNDWEGSMSLVFSLVLGTLAGGRMAGMGAFNGAIKNLGSSWRGNS